jgi:uncharacterized membrane protein YcaP (DUF421 family)
MDLVIRAAFVYLFVWLVLRALGKRQLGELTAFELVLLFVVGDLVQQSITQNDTSITAAVLAISTIALLILTQSYIVFRWRKTRPIIEGSPVMVVHDGQLLHDVLHRERMAPDDVMESARQQGIGDLSRVRVGILERDGKLAFITRDPGETHPASNEGHGIST